MSRKAIVAVLVMAVSAALPGCGFPEQDRAEVIPADRVPGALRREGGPAPTSVVATNLVAVWFVDDGALERRLEPNRGTATVADALTALVRGPDERDVGTVRTAVVDDVVVGVERDGPRASVELSSQFRDVDPDDQLLAVGQMVMTLTDVAGVGEVTFVIDGTQIAIPLPDGETTDLPVTRRQFVALVRSTGS